MNNFFVYDNGTSSLTLDNANILLIPEFAALLETERNKSKQDPEGKYKLRAFKEFKYIYLAEHWQSPYADYLQADKYEAAKRDSGITEEEFNDPIFRNACRKFVALQDSNPSLRLLQSAKTTVNRLVEYFDNIDPQERSEVDGKPIFKAKDILAELATLPKVQESLSILENQVKKDLMGRTSMKANAQEDFDPGDF